MICPINITTGGNAFLHSHLFSHLWALRLLIWKSQKKRLIVTLDATELPRCPKCGELCNRYDDVYIRSVNDFHLSIFSCRIQFPARQIRCKCGYRGNQYLDFVHPYSHCTKRFEDYIAMLCSKMTISSVSQVIGLDWKNSQENRYSTYS